MLAVACGGDDETGSTAASEAADAERPSEAVDVAAALDYFGDLAVFDTEPITVRVDSAAAEVSLPDGATVEVPAGAFAEPTVFTAGIAELDFARFGDDEVSGKLYVLATAEDVDLAAPVVLEVDVSPGSVRVTQQVDGEWRLVDVPPGETTRVPIAGFSAVPTAVVEVGAPPPTQAPLPSSDTPGDFLFTCTLALGLMFDDDPDDGSIDGAALNRALSLCTSALVRRLSPAGVYVSVACVGDRIDETGEIESAIASCATESESPTGESVGDDTTEQDNGGDQTPAASTEPAATDVASDTVVVVEGAVTGGPVVDGADAGPTVVVDNRLEFILAFGDGVITGEGVVDREIDGSNENCTDRYISPLTFDFTGLFTGEDSTTVSGTFDWRVDESRFAQLELVQLGDVDCQGRTSFASGAGEWSATWDAAARTFDGSFTIPGGLGTNTFELDATTTISDD